VGVGHGTIEVPNRRERCGRAATIPDVDTVDDALRRGLDHSLAEEFARDDVLLDLRGALVDLGDLGVAVEPLDVEVVDVAGPAVDLDRLVGDVDGDPGGLLLGHRGQHRQLVVGVVDTPG
jgi:hypothetical protein